MTFKPFEHVHAVTFERKGPILEIGTDLRGVWSDTPAGRSLLKAIDDYQCGTDCPFKQINVLAISTRP